MKKIIKYSFVFVLLSTIISIYSCTTSETEFSSTEQFENELGELTTARNSCECTNITIPPIPSVDDINCGSCFTPNFKDQSYEWCAEITPNTFPVPDPISSQEGQIATGGEQVCLTNLPQGAYIVSFTFVGDQGACYQFQQNFYVAECNACTYSLCYECVSAGFQFITTVETSIGTLPLEYPYCVGSKATCQGYDSNIWTFVNDLNNYLGEIDDPGTVTIVPTDENICRGGFITIQNTQLEFLFLVTDNLNPNFPGMTCDFDVNCEDGIEDN